MAVQTFTIAGNGDDEKLAVVGGVLTWASGGFTNRIIVGVENNINTKFGGWLRFTGVTVAQGATIVSAVLKLNNGGVGNAGSAAQVMIQCEAADNPTMPTSASDANSRTLGTAATFSPAPTTGIYSFDVTSIVQAIINRPGFASGNAVAFRLYDNGSAANNNIRVSQYEIAGAAQAAQLEITTQSGNPWYYYANQAAAL